MLILISWGLAMLDTQSLTHRYRIWQGDQVVRRAELTIQSVDRLLKENAESRKRSDKLSEASDLEYRKNRDEFNAGLIRMGFPPLDPLPPKKPHPPG